MTLLVERTNEPATTSRTRPRHAWWIEALIAVVGYELYGFVQAATDGQRVAAVRHGWAVIHLEQRLHLWAEPTLNSLVSPHHLLSISADYYYELSHAFVTAAVLVWLWRAHVGSYARLRNVLLGLSLAALLVFWLYPVAPPRLTDPMSLSDVLVRYHALGAAHPPGGFIDLYAALPSLHVAWATWCGYAVVSAGSSRGRWVALAYPLLTAYVVLATANHYVLDVAAGLALTALAVLVGERIGALRTKRFGA